MEILITLGIIYLIQLWISTNTLKNYYNKEYFQYDMSNCNCINSIYNFCFFICLVPGFLFILLAFYGKHFTINYIKIKK